MTDYTKSTNFTSKDSLSTGNPLKIIKGAEFDTEFNAIATAVATKADTNSPTLTGTPAAPTASAGTSSTQIATTAFVDASFAKKGSNSDITALSGLTTALSVTQGGTGATSITSGSLVKGNGTSAMSAASASDIVSAIGTTAVTNATNTIGYSQSWSDVTASRSLGTTYTNSTSKPIMVSISLYTDSSHAVSWYMSVAGTTVGKSSSDGAYGVPWTQISVIVPAGSTYAATVSSGSNQDIFWAELR